MDFGRNYGALEIGCRKIENLETRRHNGLMVALLAVGSAISLLSCENAPKTPDLDDKKIVSRTVRDMESLQSENGVKKQLMRAPLREEYEYAEPAYEEYTRGIEAIGFDSLGMPASRVVADYALHWTDRDVWELNGNVVVEGEQGQKLFTQQLRWDRKIKKIYSHVDCKVEQEQENDVLYGVGFEAADDFSRWTFLGVTGTVYVAAEPVADSVAVEAQTTSSAALSTTPSAVLSTTPSAADAAATPPLEGNLATPPPLEGNPGADSLNLER